MTKTLGEVMGIEKQNQVRQNIEKAVDKARAEAISLGAELPEEMSDKIPFTATQLKISEITYAMKELLIYKNEKYGDSAINPKKIFYKGDATNSILIRLDDKIGRVMSNPDEKPRVNDVCDIIGYCVLLLISMGVTKDDIAKFKD